MSLKSFTLMQSYSLTSLFKIALIRELTHALKCNQRRLNSVSISALLTHITRTVSMPFYAVKAGRKPGIYQTWAECEKQVKGFSKPVFKKFPSESQALDFIGGEGSHRSLIKSPKNKISSGESQAQVLKPLITAIKAGGTNINISISLNTTESSDMRKDSSFNQKYVQDQKLGVFENKETKSSGFFYAVQKGFKPGIYKSWLECQEQIKGFKGPIFRKFPSEKEALQFIGGRGLSIEEPRPFATYDESTLTRAGPAASSAVRPGKRAFSTSSRDAHDVRPQKLPKLQEANKITGRPFRETEDTSHVFTDGGCFDNGRNGARAGIGVFWGKNHPLNVSERLPGRPTNNRAEIHAAIKAVSQAKQQGMENLVLHTDSQFLINSITKWIKGWKKNGWLLTTGKPVVNKEDFVELDRELQGINVKWVHVKGHSGDPSNDAVDALAKQGANKALPHGH